MNDKFFGDVAALIALLAHDGKLTAAQADALYIENGKRQADARALWAVRVLDAWQLARPHRGYMTSPLGVTLYGTAERATYHDRDPDAARIAAATALVAADPSLDPDGVR